MKLDGGDELTHEMIVAEVSVHVHRLSGAVESDEDGCVTCIVHDGVFDAEDDAAMETFNRAMRSSTFRQRYCPALKGLGGDLKSLIEPLCGIWLPVSGATGVGKAVVGLSWTVAGLPFGIITTSLAAIMIARFGIEAYCSEG